MAIHPDFEVVNFQCAMFIDLDAKNGDAEADVNKIVTHLIETGVSAEEIQIFTTGNEGCHIFYPTYKVGNASEAKELAEHMKDSLSLETIDMAVYKQGQLVRKEGTINPKTGLPKLKLCDIEKYISDTKE